MHETAVFHPRDPDTPITAGDLDTKVGLDPATWPSYRKKVAIRALRVAGPFTVQIDGQGAGSVIRCDDGYLCVDARGYPYPVAADEFDLIYGADTPASNGDQLAALREKAIDTLKKLLDHQDAHVRHAAAEAVLVRGAGKPGKAGK